MSLQMDQVKSEMEQKIEISLILSKKKKKLLRI